MTITPQAFTDPVSCYDVPQRFGAISQSMILGTTNLMNCTGIVIRSQISNVAAIAHVEATAPADAYQVRFNQTIAFLLEKIKSYTGSLSSVDIAIGGNRTGGISLDQTGSTSISSIRDLRNGPFGQVGTMTIDPVTGILCCAPFTSLFVPLSPMKRKLALSVKDLILP